MTGSPSFDDPVLTIDPRRQFGRVCIIGTRVTADAVAEAVAGGESVDEVAGNFMVTREQVLVACWWYATYGLTGVSRGTRAVRAAWGSSKTGPGSWAYDAALILGGHRPGPLVDPPDVGAS